MANGNKIVVVSPHGRKMEGIISGTPKPGTCMQIKAATEPVGGRFTWEVYNRTGAQVDAFPVLIAVLDLDPVLGDRTTAYTSGERGYLWLPVPGDELNMIIADVAGTAATSDYAIGDLLQIQDGTGLLEDAVVGTAFGLAYPFILLETITDLTADYWAWVMFTGY